MFGRRKSDERWREEVKWEFVRWMEGLITVKSGIPYRDSAASDRLMALLDATGEAGTPEEWAAEFVDRLVELAGEAAASNIGAALDMDQAHALCQAKVHSLVKEYEEKLQRLKSALEAKEERRRKVEMALRAAERSRSETEKELVECNVERMVLQDRVRDQSRVIALQQERLNRCG